MLECPWTTNKLKHLSRHIRDGTTPAAGLPSYGEVMLWYDEVAAAVHKKIGAVDWTSLLEDRRIELTSRAKTIDTLRQKLQRNPGTPLPSVQDVAGVRFEAEMSLDEQDAVATALVGLFDQDDSCVKDLRKTPHSGYRAVHLWLRLPVRVEVQIRTHMQGVWANAYESAADTLGRNIRYGEIPADPAQRAVVLALQSLSEKSISSAEEARNFITRGETMAQDLEHSGGTVPADLRDTIDKTSGLYRKLESDMTSQLRNVERLFQQARGRV